MFRTQVYLTQAEREGLISLSENLGLAQSVLIREAIDQFIESKKLQKKSKSRVLQETSGLWEKRKDLPNFEALRKELDR